MLGKLIIRRTRNPLRAGREKNADMTLRKFSLLLLFWGMLSALPAQDLHFTLYDMSPLTLNPAMTGAFEGTARITGIYRDQWSSVLDNQFTTPSVGIDAPIIRGFRDGDWVGVGGVLTSDNVGESDLQTGENLLSVAYHFALDKDGANMLTLGVQGGNVSRQIDPGANGLVFADELPEDVGGGGLGPGKGGDRTANDQTNYLDFNVGLLLKSRLQGGDAVEVGLAFNHITTPEYSFITQGGSGTDNNAQQRPMTIMAHGRYQRPLTEKLAVAPSFLFQTTAGTSEIILQAMADYQLNDQFQLHFGPGYRFGDSGQILLGLTYDDNLRVGMSYDLNLSTVTDISNYRGGFELAASYIIKIFKDPDVKPAILCPRL